MGSRLQQDLVWVTGGSGFVGGHLRALMPGRGLRMRNVDRSDSDHDGPDLADAEAVLAALRDEQPGAVIHLAAQSSGAVSLREPVETIQNNLSITLGLLEAIRALEPALRPRMLSIGSCEEYGFVADDSELPLHETQVLRPSNPYAVSKAAQTLLCQQYRRTWELPVLGVRAFTHTGPGQDERFVFSDWARQIVQIERDGGRLSVGNLEVSRDVCDARDVARAYLDLLAVEWEYDVVNVCSGRETRLADALDLLREHARVPVEVRVDPSRFRPADVPRFVGAPDRLHKMTGWVPSTPISTTLSDLLEDWRQRSA
jgi:GDP-4-dehydro-6-deoxy-D-mannose reductase